MHVSGNSDNIRKQILMTSLPDYRQGGFLCVRICRTESGMWGKIEQIPDSVYIKKEEICSIM